MNSVVRHLSKATWALAMAAAFPFPAAHALEGSVGVSVVGHEAFSTAGDETSSMTLFGTLVPALTFDVEFELSKSLGLRPGLDFTPIGRSTEDDAASMRLLGFSAPVTWNLGGSADLRAGPGILLVLLSGNGGTAELENGTGTSDFALPGGSSVASVLYLDVGADWRLTEELRLGVSLWLYGVLQGRPSVDVVAQIGYEVF